ncbi:MAG: hypothetical protein JXA45_03380 [Methanomassiliicoccales archaeon]|nr:hypothetical protein [Methanomassiliicoccales archaeon]
MNDHPCVKDCLSAKEREKILSRFNSLLYWVGEMVPEMEELEGQEVPLKGVVFRFITEQFPDRETVSRAQDLAMLLERKAKALRRELATKDMERKVAYEIMHEALGLLRAVDELRDVQLKDRDLKAQALVTKVSDERRWLDLLKRTKAI